MDTSEIAERLSSFFEQDDRGVLAAYLFGSTARGSARQGSDIDVALLYRHYPTSPTLDSLPIHLQNDLEELLGAPVDIVVLSSASPDLCHRVFRDGIVVSDRDRQLRLRFEVKKRNEYLDFLPVLRLYRGYPRARERSGIDRQEALTHRDLRSRASNPGPS